MPANQTEVLSRPADRASPRDADYAADNQQEEKQQQQQQTRALAQLTLSPDDASDEPEAMAWPKQTQKKPKSSSDAAPKRRLFSAPLLRRSATATASTAASAASMLKSSLKRTNASNAHTHSDAAAPQKDAAASTSTSDAASTAPSLQRASTETGSKPAAPQSHGRSIFGLPSLMRSSTVSKDKTPPQKQRKKLPSPAFAADVSTCPLDSPEPQNLRPGEPAATDKALPPMAPKPSASTASRFVSRMRPMLQRVVSTTHSGASTSTSAQNSPVGRSTPGSSSSSTARGDFPDEELDEDERRSLLLMIQVPEAQRRSQVPLMAASADW